MSAQGATPSRVAELLDEALELPPEQRAAFVQRAAAGDSSLAREVNSLLNALSNAGGFLAPVDPSHTVTDALEGATIGRYHVVERLGEGGMGVVYRARDDRLGRSVALKVLSNAAGLDPSRRARLDREARALASLNHPNIAAIYGIEDSPLTSGPVLVLELVHGETLGARLARARPTLEEAVSIACQIARALEAAHGTGVVHRDLKPANIVIADDGTVKVLDFGLAKVTDSRTMDEPPSTLHSRTPTTIPSKATGSPPASGGSAAAPSRGSHLPSSSPLVTQEGLVVGTAAYMSPEQARGKFTDKRTDLWSFGCVLFEMLSGKRAFAGESAGAVIDAVIHGNVQWSDLPASTPPGIRRVLERCLRASPDTRLRDAGDARIELEEALSAPRASAARSYRGIAVALGIASLLLAGAAVILLNRRSISAPPRSLSFVLPEGLVAVPSISQPVRFSADGESLFLMAGPRRQPSSIYRRSLGSFDVRRYAIQGACMEPSPDGGRFACWSKVDGVTRLAVFDDVTEQLLATGPDANLWGGGLAWVDGDRLVISDTNGKLLLWDIGKDAVSQMIDPSGGDAYQPTAVLGAGAALYTRWTPSTTSGTASIYAVKLDTGGRTEVVSNAATPRVLGGDILLFTREGALWAMSFDPRTLRAKGAPVRVLDDLPPQTDYLTFMRYDVSRQGTLAYLPGTATYHTTAIGWVNDQGEATPIIDLQKSVWSVRLSHNGRYASVITHGPTDEIHIVDLESHRDITVASRPRSLGLSVWTRDNTHVIFNAQTPGAPMTWWKVPADASAEPTLIRTFADKMWCDPTDVTLDNRFIIGALNPGVGEETDLYLFPMDPDAPMQKLLPTKGDRTNGRLSPDGSLLAWAGGLDGTTRPEVFVLPYPALNQQVRVSANGGFRLSWAGTGTRLAYRMSDSLEVVDIRTTPELSVSPPLISLQDLPEGRFDSSADGRKFLMALPEGGSKPITTVNIITGFEAQVREALKKANPN